MRIGPMNQKLQTSNSQLATRDSRLVGSWGAIAVLLALAVHLTVALPTSQAAAPLLRLQEDFASDPFARDWQIAGEGSLFHWEAESGHLAVTWDSAMPNSYCYLPLGTFLTSDDDFRLEFT